MTEPTVNSFLAHYRVLSEHELGELIERLAVQPATFTEEAKVALRQVIKERDISAAEVVSARTEGRAEDRRLVAEKTAVAAKRSKAGTRVLGKVLGILGVLTASVIAIPSASAGHVGGLVTAFLTALCSLWLIFKYQGD